MNTFRIDGRRVHGISEFYNHLNLVMNRDATFMLAPSLDALNDALYEFSSSSVDRTGARSEPVTFHWTDHELSKQALGYETTMAWLQEKASQPGRFNQELISQQINDLKTGKGKTYFEIILEIFEDHPYVKLVLA